MVLLYASEEANHGPNLASLIVRMSTFLHVFDDRNCRITCHAQAGLFLYFLKYEASTENVESLKHRGWAGDKLWCDERNGIRALGWPAGTLNWAQCYIWQMVLRPGPLT